MSFVPVKVCGYRQVITVFMLLLLDVLLKLMDRVRLRLEPVYLVKE